MNITKYALIGLIVGGSSLGLAKHSGVFANKDVGGTAHLSLRHEDHHLSPVEEEVRHLLEQVQVLSRRVDEQDAELKELRQGGGGRAGRYLPAGGNNGDGGGGGANGANGLGNSINTITCLSETINAEGKREVTLDPDDCILNLGTLQLGTEPEGEAPTLALSPETTFLAESDVTIEHVTGVCGALGWIPAPVEQATEFQGLFYDGDGRRLQDGQCLGLVDGSTAFCRGDILAALGLTQTQIDRLAQMSGLNYGALNALDEYGSDLITALGALTAPQVAALQGLAEDASILDSGDSLTPEQVQALNNLIALNYGALDALDDLDSNLIAALGTLTAPQVAALQGLAEDASALSALDNLSEGQVQALDNLSVLNYDALNALDELGTDLIAALGTLTDTQVGALRDFDPGVMNKMTNLDKCLLSASADDVIFDGCNVHVRAGGSTHVTSTPLTGKGNLIVGYNEGDVVEKTGMNNLVVGPWHVYKGTGGSVLGHGNNIHGQSSTVTGGNGNTAESFSSVSGGSKNNASGQYASILGGKDNKALGGTSSISGGRLNEAGILASILGGDSNQALGDFSCVSGGQNNVASGDFSSITGGVGNAIVQVNGGGNGYGAAIHGGTDNKASGYYSSILGGSENDANAFRSSISGGRTNTASGPGQDCSILGGQKNACSGYYSTVSGGLENSASGNSASVTGGHDNTASDAQSSVSGGKGNSASGLYSTVSGGQDNTATGENSSISGGRANAAAGKSSSISGGSDNKISVDSTNTLKDGSVASILGGYKNEVFGQFATISGGQFNLAEDNTSSIAGGVNIQTTINNQLWSCDTNGQNYASC